MRALITVSVSAMAIGLPAMGDAIDASLPRSEEIVESQSAPPKASDQQLWMIESGVTMIWFDVKTLADAGLRVGGINQAAIGPDAMLRRFPVKRGSNLTFSVSGGSLVDVLGGSIRHIGDLLISGSAGDHAIGDLVIAPLGDRGVRSPWVAGRADGNAGLILERVKAGFDPASGNVTVRSPALKISPGLAAALGEPKLANVSLGAVTIRGKAVWVGGADPDSGDAEAPAGDGGAAAFDRGGDMTFCQLYGLYHVSGSRLGDIVGLSVATTSWNVGGSDMMWFGLPDEEHPFIVMNLYRLKNNRFEEIGESHIKHGFYALGSHQCGGPSCSFEPGHSQGDWLGTGCTDTYGAVLNGIQSGMGPRYGVNPWTGDWTYLGSHMQGSHGHDAIQHRIQVHDADLDPALNPGATYYVEGYYVMSDDINVMNSAAWKPVTVIAGAGGTYSFQMTGSTTYPEIGFAIDAWTGATKTVIAQEIPVEEFVSPDGRCILAAKAHQVFGDVWHYEYSLLNVDMDRQVGSFSIPIGPEITVTNMEFSAVDHHDEPVNTVDDDAVPIDNASWAPVVSPYAVKWQTASNPLRWGTVYTFGFDADAPPRSAPVTVGLFRPGAPDELTAMTTGPVVLCAADLDGSGDVGFADLVQMLSVWGPCAGCPEDIDGDGFVGFADLVTLLSVWGPCP